MSCKDSRNYKVEEFKKLYYSVREYPYTTEIIGNYREDFYKALLNIKDKGKPYLTDEQAKDIVDGYSDEALAYDMQTHTPEELAEINTM